MLRGEVTQPRRASRDARRWAALFSLWNVMLKSKKTCDTIEVASASSSFVWSCAPAECALCCASSSSFGICFVLAELPGCNFVGLSLFLLEMIFPAAAASPSLKKSRIFGHLFYLVRWCRRDWSLFKNPDDATPARKFCRTSRPLFSSSAVNDPFVKPLLDEDYVAVGLACCFARNDENKLNEAWILEPLTAGTLETIEKGIETSYKQ